MKDRGLSIFGWFFGAVLDFFQYDKFTNLDFYRQLELKKTTSVFGPPKDDEKNSFLGKTELDCQVCRLLHST